MLETQKYIISLLVDNSEQSKHVFYGNITDAPPLARIIIIQSDFFDEDKYGTSSTLPKIPFSVLPDSDIPFLFGESRIEYGNNGCIILYADLVASAFFMLSRYEEIIKPNCRDQYGRFLAKDSVIFQQGYGMRPLVDEWGRYLKILLRQVGVEVAEGKHGFSKIYLTHDIDMPFFLSSLKDVAIQFARNILKRDVQIKRPLAAYIENDGDYFYTFPWIIQKDNELKEAIGTELVESVYFIISAKNSRCNHYFSVKSHKYKKLLLLLCKSGARFGLHISHEGGINPSLVSEEIKRLPPCVDCNNLYSRNHFLRWLEPEYVVQMENAGIKHDFTLGYADSIGFRVGTCHSYYFINPKTKTITDVMIHPLQIMEGTLEANQYMGLSEVTAFEYCKKVISEVYKYNGEFVLLFHNSSFIPEKYHAFLYERILNFCSELQ